MHKKSRQTAMIACMHYDALSISESVKHFYPDILVILEGVFMSVIKTELLSPLIDIAIFQVSASKDKSSKTLIFSNTGIHEA